MLVCQRNANLQPDTESQQGVDWTQAGRAYPNLKEMPSFISRHRELTPDSAFTSTADPHRLQAKQLQAYTVVRQYFEADGSLPPLQMIVTGTAGTGKSYLIHCLRLLLKDKVRVAAFNIDGRTLHSLLALPVRGDMQGEHLHIIQQSLAQVKYLIIDEMSMVGRTILGQVDKRLCQACPHNAHEVLRGCSVLLFGDFGQLLPVGDLPNTARWSRPYHPPASLVVYIKCRVLTHSTPSKACLGLSPSTSHRDSLYPR